LIGAVFAAILHFAVHPLPEGFSLPGLQRRRAVQPTATPDQMQPIRPQAEVSGPEQADSHAQPDRTDTAGPEERGGNS
jgi:hypothetical protein